MSLAGAKRVVGSAGSIEKVKYLVDGLGYDVAFNYKDGPVLNQLPGPSPTDAYAAVDRLAL
jgi:NADPH-dependent curcumin reductase CurA